MAVRKKATTKKAVKKTAARRTTKKKTAGRTKAASRRRMPAYDKIGKREFVEIIQLSMPEGVLTRTDAAAIHDNIMAATVAAVKKKGVVSFADVGKLKYAVRKARMGRNPQTGAALKIPMKKTVKFTVAKELKSIR